MEVKPIKKVFISYSHDSEEHKKWVLELATRLRSFGIDATLDQWELKAGADIPLFMEQHLTNSDFVVLVCTDKYVEKANAGKGGVGYEKMILTADIMSNINSNKAIPIIKQSINKSVPTFVKTKLYIDFDSGYEFAFEELARTILNEPLYKKPPLGSNTFAATQKVEPEKSVEPIKNLIKIIAEFYENNNTGMPIIWAHKASAISRVMFDLLVDDAMKSNLILEKEVWLRQEWFDGIELTSAGKKFAVENNLI